MLHKLLAAVAVSFVLASSLPGCHTKPPKQVEAPDALVDKGADMSGGEDKSGDAASADDSGVEKMREKCCKQCKAALAKDRSGGKPETIPCSDFTADLDPFCLEHFRGKKTMASECK